MCMATITYQILNQFSRMSCTRYYGRIFAEFTGKEYKELNLIFFILTYEGEQSSNDSTR